MGSEERLIHEGALCTGPERIRESQVDGESARGWVGRGQPRRGKSTGNGQESEPREAQGSWSTGGTGRGPRRDRSEGALQPTSKGEAGWPHTCF